MNKFTALQAEAALDVARWLGATHDMDESIADVERSVKRTFALMDAEANRAADSVSDLEQSLNRVNASFKDIEDAIKSQAQFEEDNRRAAEASAKAEEAALEKQRQVWQAQDAAEDAARERHMLERQFAADRQKWARDEAVAVARSSQAKINAMQQEEMELEALEIELGVLRQRWEQVHNVSTKGSMFVMEFGRAIEDAAIGASFNGIQGAIVGASNNLARMAEMSGSLLGSFARYAPYVSLFVSISTALYMVVQSMTDSEDATDKANEALDRYIEKMERILELQQRNRDFIRELADAESSEDVQRILEDRARSMEDMVADQQFWIDEEARLQAERASLAATIEGERNTRGIADQASDLIFDSTLDLLQKDLAELDTQIAEAQQRAFDAKQEIGRLDEEQIEAGERLIDVAQEEIDAAFESLMLEKDKLAIQQQQTAEKERQAAIAAGMAAQDEMFSILDPGGFAQERMNRDWLDRQTAIDADPTLSSDQRTDLTARNEAAFDAQMAELFDVARLDDLTETLAGMSLEGQVVQDQYVEMANQIETLRQRFSDGEISLDQFNRSVEHIDRALEEAAQAAEEAAEAERRAALLRGDFAGAGLDMEAALEDRLAAERMREWNRLVEQQFDALYGTNDQMDEWQKQMEAYAKEQERVTDTLAAFQGDPEESMTALWAFINSLQGQIQITESEIALTQNTLAVLGESIDVFRKAELERHIDNLTDALVDLYDQMERNKYFTEVSGPAWFSDPGLQTPNGEGLTTTGRAGRGGNVIFELPNLTRMTNSEVSRQSDLLMAENRRRGVRAF